MTRLAILALALLAAAHAGAEGPIQDNSFLIEEAYNQERGVVQHINTFSRARSGEWIYTLSQEWPVPDERHQLGFTLPVQRMETGPGGRTGLGDVALNYRYGAIGNGGSPVAVAARATLLLPTGRFRDGLGAGGVGVQVNLPVSALLGRRLVTHWNTGATHTFRARDEAGDRASTNAYALGQSVVWLTRPWMNLLVETSWTRAQSVAGTATTQKRDALFVSPGVRWAHDFRSGLQIVPGVAVPIGVGPSRGERALFLYLSFEHSFRAPR